MNVPNKQFPANLGKSINVPAADHVVGYRNNITKLDWFGDHCIPWMTNRITLFAEPLQPIPDNSAWIVKAIAHISFGVGATRSFVEIDFKRGAQLSLPGNTTEVSLEIIEVVGTPDVDFRYGAMVQFGGDARAGHATRTTAQQTFTGASTPIPVPPFAYAVTVAAPVPDAGTHAVIFSGSGDNIAAIIGISPLNTPEPVPIPGGTQSVILVVDADPPVQVTEELVFLIQV